MITDQQWSEIFQTGVYPELLGVHDYITLGHCMTQQEEETMNDNLNTPVANANMAAVQADWFTKPLLTDEELAALLAAKPDGIVGYTTDAIETDDEATETSPTIH